MLNERTVKMIKLGCSLSLAGSGDEGGQAAIEVVMVGVPRESALWGVRLKVQQGMEKTVTIWQKSPGKVALKLLARARSFSLKYQEIISMLVQK